MAMFSETITVSGTSYPGAGSADATIPFEPKLLRLRNLDSTNDAFVRFGPGTADKVRVPAGDEVKLGEEGGWAAPGSTGEFGVFSGIEVFARSSAGTPLLAISAES